MLQEMQMVILQPSLKGPPQTSITIQKDLFVLYNVIHMNKEQLLILLEQNIEYYETSLNKMKEDPDEVGPYGPHSPFYPIYGRKIIAWLFEFLEKMGLHITPFEERIAEMDEEFEVYINNHKEEVLNSLYVDLIKLIDNYEAHFTDFQNKKDYFITSEAVSPLYKEYFGSRKIGLYFMDGYEFDILISIRTYIEILFEYMGNVYDLTELKAKVQEMDNIFKKDFQQLLKILEFKQYYSLCFYPSKYWWHHIDMQN
jgi:hypothetical protein